MFMNCYKPLSVLFWLPALDAFIARVTTLLVLGGLFASLTAMPIQAQSTSPLVVENFESYREGAPPSRWKYISKDQKVVPVRQKMNDSQRFYVQKGNGNAFLRAYTENEALRITQRNGKEFDWTLDEQPYLQWKWRAHQLPEGASEKGKNDTGGAVYVTFGKDWLGRPKSIKYTYSSTLPVGTSVSFGPLKALVVASAEEGLGNWRTETRNVVQDYRNLFGEKPPQRPLSVTLWSDTDTTGGTAEVDFDDIRLLAQP